MISFFGSMGSAASMSILRFSSIFMADVRLKKASFSLGVTGRESSSFIVSKSDSLVTKLTWFAFFARSWRDILDLRKRPF